MALILWSLLRLPSWQHTRGDWIRFGLDCCVVLVTSSTFVWHFSLRNHEQWMTQTGSAGAMLAIVVVALVSLLAFAKVGFAGAGRLDRRAIHILAAGGTVSTGFGGMSPFLSDRPYLSSSLIAVPVAAFSIQLAANRQRRNGGQLPPPRRPSRRISVIPYLAVAATDALMLLTGSGNPAESTVIEVSAIALTALVVARQIIALRDNKRLLTTVDTSLAQLRAYQRQLTHEATHDGLTGIPNRTLFEQRVKELAGAGTTFHAALLDLDDFKTVNDRLGHGTGDELLKIIGQRLGAVVGPAGTVARLGGDEFVLVLPDLDTERLGAVLADALFALQTPVVLAGQTMRCTGSIGVTAGRLGDRPDEVLRRADVAMYDAKAHGGQRWHWFDPVMDEKAQETARIGADLQTAVDRDELRLLYQPIVDLSTGAMTGVEALLRWHHPDRGMIPPDIFIPLAERNGAIVAIGRWVLEQACRQAAAWQNRYGDQAPAKVSINVSARQLAEPDFLAVVEEILTRTGVDRRRLLIEITETAVLTAGASLDTVRRLRQHGLRVALDDFGTGQSSLSLLLNCPVDVLKVDKSFVSGSSADRAGAVIVENLIGFINGLGLEAVAEGVETPEQAQRLRLAGYTLAQGYLFGRPMSASDIERRLDPAATHSGDAHARQL